MGVIRLLAVLCLGFTLTACGGGGSSTPATSSDSGSGSDGGGSSGGGSTGNQPAAAKIQFPPARSHAIARTITVRGTATDPDGISEVLVNGVSATLSAVTSATSLQKLDAGSTTYNATDSGTQDVQWSAQVPVASGDNDVSVTVVDDDGDHDSDVDNATVSYTEVPIQFSLDADMNRVVGVAATLYPFARNLVDYDYLNQVQTRLMDNIDSYAPGCYKSDSNEYLHLRTEANHTLVLHSYNVSTDTDSVVITEQLDPATEGYADAVYLGNMVCGPANESAYLLLNYAASGGGGFAKTTILEFDLVSQVASSLSETNPAESPAWIADNIVLTDTSLITHGGLNNPSPLFSVDLATGVRTVLTPSLPVDGVRLADYSTEDIAYMIDFDGVYEIDIAAETSTNLSVVDSSDPFVFSQVRRAAFDQANNRVIVSDEDLDVLVSVDLSTGHRSELLARNIGSGTNLVAPRAFAITADSSTAYIADDGSNAPERLFEVDLATGNRTVVGNINQYYNQLVGIALDEANGQVYVAFAQKILVVDIGTGNTTVIADSTTGSGVVLSGISDILLDPLNPRLILADAATEALISLDLDTLDRTVLSADGAKGSGPPFENINSIDVAPDGSTIYASNQLSENIMSVNVETGDREVILDQCLDQSYQDVLGNYESLMQVLLDQSNNRLLLLGDNLIALDLTDNSCNILRDYIHSAGILQLGLTSDNDIMATAFKSLGIYDLETDQYVMISK